MKIIFAGTPSNAAETLAELVSSGHEVVAVLTREDALVGRKKILTQSSVAETATQLGIPVIKANRITDDVRAALSEFEANLGVVVAYGVLFDKPTLELFQLGWVNVHYSLLPKWRGASPVQASILNADKTTGVTIFQLDEGMDSGPVLNQVETEIQPRENSGQLLHRLTLLGISLLLETLPSLYAGLATAMTQTDKPTFASKLNREDMKINWKQNAYAIELLVRAANPEPMAWAFWREQPIQILEAFCLEPSSEARISEIKNDIGDVFEFENQVLVQTGEHSFLCLITVKPSGKSEMSASDWFRGSGSDRRFF